ncbi:MAG TPA: hypothetical protein VFQ40_07395 [Actinomycetota bacterium]|nr:hypothetical protein [Actinomycetota bacterium]
MAKTGELLTAAKLADAWGVPKATLSRRLKEEHVQPDLVKAGCSYYDVSKVQKLRQKLKVERG